MAKRKMFPGTIFSRVGNSRLIIKLKNRDWQRGDPENERYRTIHTGLPDSPQGRAQAQKILEQEWLRVHGLLTARTDTVRIAEAWEQYVQIKRGQLQPKTLSGYEQAYSRIVHKNFVLTEDNVLACVREFLAAFTDSDTTRNVYLTAFQVFLNWCTAEKLLSTSVNISRHRVPVQHTIQTFTREECTALYEYFCEHDPEFAVLLELMRLTGARISDALSLTWEQIDVQARTITWRNKRSKQKECVPVAPVVVELLRQVPRRGSAAVFRWQVSSDSRLRRRLYDAMKELKIARNGRSFHEFRKTYCSTIFDLGLPIAAALTLVRHKTVDVTIKHYLARNEEALHEAIKDLR